MQMLPQVTTWEFNQRFRAFDELARFYELAPPDRNLMWREYTGDEDFYEWPVPVSYFLTDPFYTGTNLVVRPKIGEFLADFGDPDELAELFVFIAGIGSGKSWSAAVFITYTLYALNCLRQPQRYLSKFPGCQLSGDAEIVVLNASAAGARQAIKIIYSEVYEKVVRSPWFLRYAPPYANKRSELEWPNRLRFSPGTGDPRSALGFNVFAFVIDEAAFGIENVWTDTNQVRSLFEALNQRRRSRFGRLGWGGLFTSPQSEHAYIELIASEAGMAGSEVLVRRISTWEAKDELRPGAEVFLVELDPNTGPRVLPDRGLRYIAPGLCQGPMGELIRFGPQAPDQPVEATVQAA
jgi:hypothetical protein